MTEIPAERPDQTSKASRGATVLVVDDDPIFLAMMEEVLRHHGAAEVILANDGQKGLEVLRRDPQAVDIITLDLSMPNLDGVAFLRKASELAFRGRLVLISGEHQSVLSSAAKLAEMMQIDCVATFPKPVDFDRVAETALSAGHFRKRKDLAVMDADEINAGLRNSRLVAHYQPKVDLRTGLVVGAEALARMRDSEGRLLDAGDMINLAEENGRITDITWRMIETVIEDAARLTEELATPVKLSFNISSLILSNSGFPSQLGDMVRFSGMKPEDFIIELTESRIPTDASQSLEALTRIRLQGFGLAIDDFGTGYSNIEQLKIYPFSELKIDKSYMNAASHDGFALAVVEASVALARQLELRIVAEGIETEQELELARRCGIDEAQGYLFSRPLPFRDFVDFVKAAVPGGSSVSSVA